ncbi:hypothetical protein [Streptomyces sp. WMMC940]|uniref:hypothetical protein n=1 Tax=Streptomyces sp. WMMC940 TaxID=3015153 RepID=UPI0022B60A2B|nr:hypothetical protein [Streptomyces sp. WMMC940]MCZ7456285.1 hypothetical protein [Streptomyces sp. WMMC940]
MQQFPEEMRPSDPPYHTGESELPGHAARRPAGHLLDEGHTVAAAAPRGRPQPASPTGPAHRAAAETGREPVVDEASG